MSFEGQGPRGEEYMWYDTEVLIQPGSGDGMAGSICWIWELEAWSSNTRDL